MLAATSAPDRGPRDRRPDPVHLDDDLELLQRINDQIEHCGFHIEFGEIESALYETTDVESTAVTIW